MNSNIWYNKDTIPELMVQGALGVLDGWKRLEYSDHYWILDKFIELSYSEHICDLGCGAGELGRLKHQNYKYTGYDLNHIIDNVFMKLNPNLNYVKFDINEFDYTNLLKYDLIVCNAFLTEMSNVEFILKNILKNVKKNLIIHRQDFSDKTYILNTKTYGNLDSIRSVIGWEYLYELLENENLYIAEQHNINNNSFSLLIKTR